MMSIHLGSIVIERGKRSITLQPMNDNIYYGALRAFGVRESVAAAATRGLITVKIGANK